MSTTLLPSLLNEQLVKRALQSLHNVNNASAFSIKACTFKLSPANGENFASEIYHVDVQYVMNGNAEQKSFIVKIMIPAMAELGSNEEIMLNTVLPRMETCLSGNKLHAKCLVSDSKDEEFYVLENLNSLGYYCADRSKGLDLDHALILMEKIAKFHAASMMFAKKFPEVLKSLKGSRFELGLSDEVSQAIAYGGIEYVANMIKNWPTYENLTHKLLALIPKFDSLALEVVDSRNSTFNVIHHGDLWVNNFLYKYAKDSSKPIDVLFVDFQLCFWGSCGNDINCFFYSSLELEVLRYKRDLLIETYHETLSKTLAAENYPEIEIPSLDDVVREVRHCEFMGLYISLCEFPFVALDKSKSQGFDISTFGQPEKMKTMRVLMFDNPRVKETLKYTLKYFEEINLL